MKQKAAPGITSILMNFHKKFPSAPDRRRFFVLLPVNKPDRFNIFTKTTGYSAGYYSTAKRKKTGMDKQKALIY